MTGSESQIVPVSTVPAGSLSFLLQAKQYLAQAFDFSDIRSIRDKAEAIRQYAKAQGEGLAIQNKAAEVKIRAERRAGELLSDAVSAGNPQLSQSGTIALKDVGISRNQSSRWQQEASVPDERFEQYVKEMNESARELTSSGLQSLAKSIRNVGRNDIVVSESSAIDDLNSILKTGKKFGCIYADPPWKYGNQKTRAATDNHYPTMTVEDIAALPIEKLAADDAHLHLWTTNGFLPESFQLMTDWGFEYRSCYVWVKPQMGIGNYWRVSHEFMLLGIRGNAKKFHDHSLMSWGEFSRSKHSRKPDEVRAMIERASAGPYLELFGRQAVKNWTVWGNQVADREDELFDEAEEEVAAA